MPLPGGSGWRMSPVRTPEWSPCPFTTTLRAIVRCGQLARRGDVRARRQRRLVGADRSGPVRRGRDPRPGAARRAGRASRGSRSRRGGSRARPSRSMPWPEITTIGTPRGGVPHALHQLDAVDLRHPHVDDRQPRHRLSEHRERVAAVLGLEHVVALVRAARHAACGGSSPRRRRPESCQPCLASPLRATRVRTPRGAPRPRAARPGAAPGTP